MEQRFEPKAGAGTIAGLQYLRALAALLVVVHHSVTGKTWLEVNPLAGVDLGAAGVQLFFVISGYIIFRVGSREDFGKFVYSRITRIVPLYWIYTLIFVALKVAFAHDIKAVGGGEIVKSLLFVPHYSAFRPDQIWPVLVPGWTLNYEMFFYALFAIGILFQRPALVSVVCILTAILIGSIFANEGAAAEFLANPITLFFVLGVLVARYEAFLPKKPIFMAAGVVLWTLALLLPVVPLVTFAIKCLAAPLILLGVLVSRDAERSPARTFFKGLGDASYSIYLVHTIILAVIYKILSRMNWHGYEEFALLVVVGLSVSTVAGLFSYWFIEKPLMRVFKVAWHRRQELFRVA